MTPEEKFRCELDIARRDTNSCIQFLNGHIAIHRTLSGDQQIYNRVNKRALFWRTVDGALHTSLFIALGRRFDQTSPHNLDSLVGLAKRNQQIFSINALAARKLKLDPSAQNTWLPDYLKGVYVPGKEDFKALKAVVGEIRSIYNAKYRDIRNKVQAHAELSDDTAIEALYGKTNIDEISKLLGALQHINQQFQNLFNNGTKPHWKPSAADQDDLAERMQTDTASVLASLRD